MLDALDPQLPQLVPFAVEQHLARQEVFLHLWERVERALKAFVCKAFVLYIKSLKMANKFMKTYESKKKED